MCNPQCDTTKCGFDNYECEGSPHTHPYYADDSFNWTPGFKAAEDTSLAAETETEIKTEEKTAGYSIWAILVIAIVAWMAYKR